LSSAAKGINKANAPVPTPLLSGKKVFISFDPSDVLAFPSVYSGGPERAYNELFADMTQWGAITRSFLTPKTPIWSSRSALSRDTICCGRRSV
jgi:hypothetical protein